MARTLTDPGDALVVLTQPRPVGTPASRRPAPERRSQPSDDQIRQRVRAEFDELQGLMLTLPQAARLFGLSQEACVRVLNALIHEHLLRRTPDGHYARQ